jgi:hypothetical protein
MFPRPLDPEYSSYDAEARVEPLKFIVMVRVALEAIGSVHNSTRTADPLLCADLNVPLFVPSEIDDTLFVVSRIDTLMTVVSPAVCAADAKASDVPATALLAVAPRTGEIAISRTPQVSSL